MFSWLYRTLAPNPQAGGLHLFDHLEALRQLILQMAAVLLAGTALCFCFSDELMQLLRQPAEQVWAQYEQEHLPEGVSSADWERALALADLRPQLSADARAQLEQRLSPQVRQLADSIPLLRAAALLPESERVDYLRTVGDTLTVEALNRGTLQLVRQGGTAQQLMGSFRPSEAFLLSLQVSLWGGAVLSLPLLLALLLRFAAPGLLRRERRLLLKLVLSGTALFLTGAAFAYFAVLPRVLHFFFTYALGMGVANDWRIGYYLSFAGKLVFMCGAIFELPVVLLPLIRLRLLTYEQMSRSRSYAVVACAALALLLAPAPDPGTMLLMAAPLYALYELCTQLARFCRAPQQP